MLKSNFKREYILLPPRFNKYLFIFSLFLTDKMLIWKMEKYSRVRARVLKNNDLINNNFDAFKRY